jgi:hypothetical protein
MAFCSVESSLAAPPLCEVISLAHSLPDNLTKAKTQGRRRK